jgi:hypothetical protein
MPKSRVVIYREADGTAPFVDWFRELPSGGRSPARWIYEHRATAHGAHYRVLYFFHKRTAAVVALGLAKESNVAAQEINLAIRRKAQLRPIRPSIRLRRHKMALKRKATADAVEILQRKLYTGDPEKLKSLAQCRANDEIARKIHALRTQTGLTKRNWQGSSVRPLRSFAGWKTPTMKGIRSPCSVGLRPHWTAAWKFVSCLCQIRISVSRLETG